MIYEAVIGLEVHVELKTNTKIYCGCKNSFGAEANTNVCPVCMGLPGALPVLNKKALELAIKTGLALSCTIQKTSYQDRKNYFYPDLPKAYQISQNQFPLCRNGYLELNKKKINIERIHIEEDAGKLIHNKNTTVIDFNRCGVPLIEIVTEPDIRSSDEAVAFLEALKEILEYTDVSDCKMQEGSIRCDVNISLRPFNSKEFGTRCEIKNLNSFTAVKNAINFEIERQSNILNSEKKLFNETRRWDDDEKKTISMRTKEDCFDYRYLPDPDLPPIIIEDKQIEDIKKTITPLPRERRKRYMDEYGLSDYDAKILTSVKAMSDFFESCLLIYKKPKIVANWLMGEVLRILNANNLTFEQIPFSPDDFSSLLILLEKDVINNNIAKNILSVMFKDSQDPKTIVEKFGFAQISDEEKIKSIVEKTLFNNAKSVEDYKNGNTRAFGYLIGQAMKLSGGKANPKLLNEFLEKTLKN